MQNWTNLQMQYFKSIRSEQNGYTIFKKPENRHHTTFHLKYIQEVNQK